jgi:flagellar basal body-associated protein FliL
MAKQPEKKDDLEQNAVPAEDAAEGVSERKPRSPRLIILLSLVTLVLFQVLALFWILPTPQKIKAEIEDGKIILDPPNDFRTPVDAVPQTGIKPEDLLEKTIGDPFRVQDPNPDNPGATDVFSVAVILKIDKKDERKFDKLLLEQPATIRSIVYAVLRSSTLTERKQETLGAIRNKILTKVNEHFGSNYVKDVVCDNPSVTSM